MALDVYQAVTDRILELLDKGTAPWRYPIRGGAGNLPPTNLSSDRAYRGINVFLLAITAMVEGYDSPYWLTFKQAKQRSGSVRKGEKGSLVIFWKQYATKDKQTGEDITVPVLRHYTVFNAAQCDGVDVPVSASPDPPADPFEVIQAAETIVDGYTGGPAIKHGGSQACYMPKSDVVRIAEPERFTDGESYYSALFHELVHSTGHSKRLGRGLDTAIAPFGTPDYSKEELVAEMGAAFLAAAAGIGVSTVEQSAAYIDGWRRKISTDKKLVVSAAGEAQKAADLVLGVRFDESP